jgi:hypothetical protein
MNFDEFKKPLPKESEEVSKGIDGLLNQAKFLYRGMKKIRMKLIPE